MRPYFLFGAARSGTNALTWALERSGTLSVFNENDDRCFVQFLLMDEPILDNLIETSEVIPCFFKSFHDTPRAQLLINRYDAKAIYSVRSPLDCIGSFVNEFGSAGASLWVRRFEQAASGCGFALQMCRGDRVAREISSQKATFVLNLLSKAGYTTENVAAGYYIWAHSFVDHIKLISDQRLKVVDYDVLVANPQACLDVVCKHLEISNISSSVQDWSRGRGFGKHVNVDEEMKNICYEIYKNIVG